MPKSPLGQRITPKKTDRITAQRSRNQKPTAEAQRTAEKSKGGHGFHGFHGFVLES